MALTREAAAALFARVRRRKAYAYLREFVRDAWPVLEPGINTNEDWNWHLDAICDHVQWMLEGWILKARPWLADEHVAPDSPARTLLARGEYVQNLLVNLAPATLKSKIVMVFAPAWMWLHVPDWTVAALSGNPDNVVRDSDACRDLVQSAWYRETFNVPWRLRDDIASKGKWRTDAHGERISRGLNAAATGIHVDAIFLDDPDEAGKVYGEAARREVRLQWAAYGNRVNSLAHSIRIVVQQRVHIDDLSAHLEGQGGWTNFTVDVEFHPAFRCVTPWGWRDPRTKMGENLHSARFTPTVLAAERRRLGAQYEAQYNQRPESLEGGMFKRASLRFFIGASGERGLLERPPGCRPRVGEECLPAIALPKLEEIALTVDGTFGSQAAAASRVGIMAVGLRGADRFVLRDRTRKMSGVGEMVAEIISMVEWVARHEDWPKVRKVIIEKKALGAAVVEKLEDMIRENKLRGVVVVPIDPKNDSKESRAAAMEADINQGGHLYVEDGAEWLVRGTDHDDTGFVSEFCAFPGGKNDDRVDTLSQLWRHFAVHKTQARLGLLLEAARRRR